MAKKFVPQFGITAKSQTEADIFLYGPIGDSWWSDGNGGKKFVQDFTAAQAKYDRINVRINSPGGDIHEGLPMFNAIKASKKDIHTYNDGIAASMGAMILLAGKTVHAAKGSITMLHNASSGVMGNANDLRDEANTLDVYDDVLGGLIADKTGKTLDQVKKDWMNYKDHFMSAQTAADNKLVDVVEDYEPEPTPDNLTNLNYGQIMNFYDPKPEKALTLESPAVQALATDLEQRIIDKLKNENMSLFGPDFPKLNAIKGKKPADITEEEIQGIIAELKEKGFDNIAIISTAHVQEATDNAGAITTSLEVINAALGAGKKPTLAEAAAALVAENVALAAKVEEYGSQPGEKGTNAVAAAAAAAAAGGAAATVKPKMAGGLPVDDKYLTEEDEELAARNKALHRV